MHTNSACITLTATNFRREVLENRQPVFVEFTADWSGSSHIMAPAIRETSVRFKDYIKFCRINVDEYQGIGRKYAVQHIPTILLFQDGHVVDSIIGAVPKKILARKLNALLTRYNE